MKMDFWFEFGSTYSYPAAMRIEELASNQGVDIVWRLFLLGPIFQAQGWNDSPFNIYPAMGRYMWRDLERICANYKIPFHRPSQFPRNGLLAARIACSFSSKPWVADFVRAIYRANFSENLDISKPETVCSCIDPLGEDPNIIIRTAQSDESKRLLREQTEKAKEAGIFGAPSFLVGHELFWGNDRLEEALSWAVENSV